MLKLVCIFAVILFLMSDIVCASMTICDCETAKTCRQGDTQKGTCTIGGVKRPRCCKTTGQDDGCQCKDQCKPTEYQQEDCVTGFLCCPRKTLLQTT